MSCLFLLNIRDLSTSVEMVCVSHNFTMQAPTISNRAKGVEKSIDLLCLKNKIINLMLYKKSLRIIKIYLEGLFYY